MPMKKITVIALLLAMLISITACSGFVTPNIEESTPAPTMDDTLYVEPTGETGLETEAIPEDTEETNPVETEEPSKQNETQPKETEPKETTPPPTEPGHEHTYTEKVVAPTCEGKGYTEYKCSCGKSYKDNYTDPIGHSWDGGKTVAATCTEGGYKLYTCTRSGCSKTDKRDKTAALGHAMSTSPSSDTAPTCTSAGKRTFKCTRSGCTYSKTENYGSPLGHSLSTKPTSDTAPTCTAAGKRTYSCTRTGCTYSKTETYGSALGHDYKSSTSTVTTKEWPHVYDVVTTTYTCTRCSHSYSETGSKTLHKYDVDAAMAWGNSYALSIGFKNINYSFTLNNSSYYPYDVVEASFIYDYGFNHFVQDEIQSTANQLDGRAAYDNRPDQDHYHATVRCYIWYIESSDSYGIVCLYG